MSTQGLPGLVYFRTVGGSLAAQAYILDSGTLLSSTLLHYSNAIASVITDATFDRRTFIHLYLKSFEYFLEFCFIG
jgi:hypothetical protein